MIMSIDDTLEEEHRLATEEGYKMYGDIPFIVYKKYEDNQYTFFYETIPQDKERLRSV